MGTYYFGLLLIFYHVIYGRIFILVGNDRRNARITSKWKSIFLVLVKRIVHTIYPRFVRTLNQCWWQVLGSPIQGDFFFEVVVLFGMTRQWHSMIHVGRPINHQKFSSENYAWCSSFEQLCVGLRKSSLNSSSC